jgi:hypothetical protein
MIRRNHIFEIELIEKTVLPTYSLTHHRPNLLAQPSQARNHISPRLSTDFFNSLSQQRTFERSILASSASVEYLPKAR